ncbi:nicotinamide-nucleotide amidohydrolase family protein [Pseudomonas syringae]|uniref:CinA family protein n=1 Tax=Pseudomonas syringae TaxID=317 RepID=UPI001F2DFA59|nr:CinA family protein [Pseudomonas syringae]MCF5709709.1 nicotinamide-nucleotide amidohydrolase family protein [Pseudomonas syringae]
MKIVEEVVSYLRDEQLLLVTAESCTAGEIITLMAQIPGSGSLIECGYVVYSPEAKQRVLGVSADTIERFNLTSCEVAREMVLGALRESPATVAVATTGICGPDDVDGIPAGTVCFAWGFVHEGQQHVVTHQHHFSGERETVQHNAALYALERIPEFHRHLSSAAPSAFDIPNSA